MIIPFGRRLGASLVLGFVVIGCVAGEAREMPEGGAAGGVDHMPLVEPQYAAAGVKRRLYEDNLIRDPEVNARMNDAVASITQRGAAPDSVMPAFYRWLDHWAATHPAEVEAARLAGGAYTAEARSVYTVSDSALEAQADSIRRSVRAEIARLR